MAGRTEKKKAYFREYYKKNKERLLKAKRRWWKEWYPKHKLELLPEIRRKKWLVKREVLTHYGNGKCACVKCSYNDLRALSLDHIEGGGSNMRRQTGSKGGVSFYRLLRKQNYPLGYQTLCMNCQFIKKIENLEQVQ